MMFFSYSDFGYELHLYSLQHLIATVVFLFLPVALLVIFKHRIMSSKNEKYIRILIGASGLALEFIQYGWYIFFIHFCMRQTGICFPWLPLPVTTY